MTDRPAAHEGDALASPRTAADLCGVPTRLVVDLIRDGIIPTTTIRGRAYVSLADVARAIRSGVTNDLRP